MAKRKRRKGGSEAVVIQPNPKPRPMPPAAAPITRRREDVVQAAHRVVKRATEDA